MGTVMSSQRRGTGERFREEHDMIKESSQTSGSGLVPTGIVLTLIPPPPPPLGIVYQLPVENSRIDHG
jgi:hypothetical protein